MLNYDYAINVYYDGKYVCSLVARNCGGYDNVVWRQLSQLIESYKDQEITNELIKNTIEDNSDYFKYINNDLSKEEKFFIDFAKSIVSIPTHPVYDFKDFEDALQSLQERECKL